MSTKTSKELLALEVSESFSKEETDYFPLLAREEREDSSYARGDLAQTLAEMEETLFMMERKYAAFVRHAINGPMGKGHIPLSEKACLVVALLSLTPSETEGETSGAEENGSDAFQESYTQLTGVQRFVIVKLGQFLSRIVLFVLGFYWIKVTRRDKEQDERLLKEGMILLKTDLRLGPIVSYHDYIDIFYYMSAAFPSFVAKRSVPKIPLVGLVSKCLGCVYVHREDKPSDVKGVAERREYDEYEVFNNCSFGNVV
ncbi:hypothetical protein GOP47_0001872 [Adiantum capillus-veneris]|uniref:Uncharacterized protein n=1 Tax=Adiantum capillus-veneris TaxID=13818 RepID=A0A9D4V9S6_ADICA|nr:hypothetical protein GOP47_0001872 [Adiantum capillus-veneris]